MWLTLKEQLITHEPVSWNNIFMFVPVKINWYWNIFLNKYFASCVDYVKITYNFKLNVKWHLTKRSCLFWPAGVAQLFVPHDMHQKIAGSGHIPGFDP